MQLHAKLGRVILLGAAIVAPAFGADPFPNQPGALSLEEIKAATAVMESRLGGERAPPLVASGKRHPGHPMPGYALFAAPLVDYSDRVKVRKRVVCNQWREARQWRCSSLHDEFRMSANGLEHVFAYQVTQGSGNSQTAVDVAGFMYSQCFNAQYTAISGKAFTPSPDSDYVNTVVDDGKGFNVVTGPLGDGNSYRLEKTGRSVDNCGFRIQDVRVAKPDLTLPEIYAKEAERQAANERAAIEVEQAEARRKAEEQQKARALSSVTIAGWTTSRNDLVGKLMVAAIIVSLAAIVAPWFVGFVGNRWAAAAIAGVLAVAATGLFLTAEFFYMPGDTVRLDLFFIPPLLLLAWAQSIRYAFKATAGEAVRYRQVRLGLWTFLLAFVVFPVGVIALQSLHALGSPAGVVFFNLFMWPAYAARLITTDPGAVFVLGLLFQLLYCYAIVRMVAWLWSKRSTPLSGHR